MYKETYKSMQQKEAYIKQYKKKEFKVHKNLNNYWQNINNQLKNQIQMINWIVIYYQKHNKPQEKTHH
jgi:putative methionine-R-sulfoxide reductase with GAF domain